MCIRDSSNKEIPKDGAHSYSSTKANPDSLPALKNTTIESRRVKSVVNSAIIRGALGLSLNPKVQSEPIIGKTKRYETGKEFVTRPEFKRFVDGMGAWKWSTDQTLLNYWIKKENMAQQELSWKWNALYTAIPDKNIKEAYFVHFFLKDKLPNGGENVEELMEKVH